ncbi:MAG: hypothetical protein DRQ44_04370 [Gammaproteobacteria bacterium]|nr:MAG: hypothetical protein DRQ44_04370 [Gammaproteobacteria bacterium]
MPENKLFARMKKYLDLDAKRRKEKAGKLKKVIKKLKKLEKELTTEYQNTATGEEQKTLENRIVVLHAQRKKGLKALKKINQE